MLFHITGPAGSGKTTLGNKLSKIPNTVIIDTDEIDDANAMDIINDPQFNKLFKNENTVDEFFQILEQKNMEKLGEILKENKNSNIIIVGIKIYPPGETAVQGYSIDISADSNYFQLNNRTLDSICSNCVDLKDLMEKEPNKYKIDLIMLFKYKIRRSFPVLPIQINDGIELRKKHAHEIGYKYLSQEKIVEDIINTISKAKTEGNKESAKLARYNKSKLKSKSKRA